jgi:hypothetical protein
MQRRWYVATGSVRFKAEKGYGSLPATESGGVPRAEGQAERTADGWIR